MKLCLFSAVVVLLFFEQMFIDAVRTGITTVAGVFGMN